MPLILWDELWDINLMLEPGVPSLPGGSTAQTGWIMSRAMECLGSIENYKVFMLVEEDINAAKNYVGLCFPSLESSFFPRIFILFLLFVVPVFLPILSNNVLIVLLTSPDNALSTTNQYQDHEEALA
jgi:hypothetical protein